MMKRRHLLYGLVILLLMIPMACDWSGGGEARPRLSLFIGVDISGSFIKSGYFDDSLDFLAHYIHAHLNGYGGLEKPNVLFVGSIGGAKADEPKTFYPIHTFANKTVEEIRSQLAEIFPKDEVNPFTDYNAFFEQVALTVKNRNLVLRPISVVMISDGKPDIDATAATDFRSLVVRPLERLARNVTIRLLYTDAVTGKNWQTRVPRRRVKIWTQDANVMVSWKDPGILQPDTPPSEQKRFFTWIEENVDFGVRAQRVD
ncbi:hypothetical protein JXO52_10160 [bacterium]|nr:hypothetical protein [bacterium]